MKYKYRSRRFNVSAEVAAKELDRIQSERGVVQPEIVVDEAKPKDALLHPVFEWQDKKAAQEYRLWQARSLIKSVQVIVEEDAEPEPVYVHVSSDDKTQSGYQPVSVVVRSPVMYAQAVMELSNKLHQAQRSLDALKSAADAEGADEDRMMRIMVAMQALQTANDAVRALQ